MPPFIVLDWPPHIARAPGFACPPTRHWLRNGDLRVVYATRDELAACIDTMKAAWAVQQWRKERTA